MCNSQTKPSQSALMFMQDKHDPGAFDHIYQAYGQAVYSYLAGIGSRRFSPEIEDMVQEVFLRAWGNRRQFRGESNLKTYLLGIARMVLLEKCGPSLKHLTNQSDWLLENNAPEQKQAADRPATPEQTDLLLALGDALSKLSRPQRLALHLYYFQSKPVSEAAALLNCSAAAFKKRLSRARNKLQQILQKMEART